LVILFSLLFADSLPIGTSTHFLENGVFGSFGSRIAPLGELADKATLQAFRKRSQVLSAQPASGL
jgi:hypothetical protein